MITHRPDSIKKRQDQEAESLDRDEMFLQMQYELELIKLGGNVKDESFT